MWSILAAPDERKPYTLDDIPEVFVDGVLDQNGSEEQWGWSVFGNIRGMQDAALSLSGMDYEKECGTWMLPPAMPRQGTIFAHSAVSSALPVLKGKWRACRMYPRKQYEQHVAEEQEGTSSTEQEPCGAIFWHEDSYAADDDADQIEQLAKAIRDMDDAGGTWITNNETTDVLDLGWRFIGRYSWPSQTPKNDSLPEDDPRKLEIFPCVMAYHECSFVPFNNYWSFWSPKVRELSRSDNNPEFSEQEGIICPQVKHGVVASTDNDESKAIVAGFHYQEYLFGFVRFSDLPQQETAETVANSSRGNEGVTKAANMFFCVTYRMPESFGDVLIETIPVAQHTPWPMDAENADKLEVWWNSKTCEEQRLAMFSKSTRLKICEFLSFWGREKKFTVLRDIFVNHTALMRQLFSENNKKLQSIMQWTLLADQTSLASAIQLLNTIVDQAGLGAELIGHYETPRYDNELDQVRNFKTHGVFNPTWPGLSGKKATISGENIGIVAIFRWFLDREDFSISTLEVSPLEGAKLMNLGSEVINLLEQYETVNRS